MSPIPHRILPALSKCLPYHLICKANEMVEESLTDSVHTLM